MQIEQSEVVEWRGVQVLMDGILLEHVIEFKYSLYVLSDSSTDEAECHRKVASERKVAVAVGA